MRRLRERAVKHLGNPATGADVSLQIARRKTLLFHPELVIPVYFDNSGAIKVTLGK